MHRCKNFNPSAALQRSKSVALRTPRTYRTWLVPYSGPISKLDGKLRVRSKLRRAKFKSVVFSVRVKQYCTRSLAPGDANFVHTSTLESRCRTARPWETPKTPSVLPAKRRRRSSSGRLQIFSPFEATPPGTTSPVHRRYIRARTDPEKKKDTSRRSRSIRQ